jgi:hypothetical protein
MSDTPSPSGGDAWARPHFAPAAAPGDGDALLFFAVFGDWGTSAPNLALDFATRARYGVEPGIVECLDATAYQRAEGSPVFDNLLGGQIGRLLDQSLDAEAARAVRAAPTVVTLRFDVPDPATLGYLRDAVGVVTALADAGSCAGIFDAMSLRWRTAAEWREQVFVAPDAEDARPDLLGHADILVSEDERGDDGRPRVWVHTRGLRKFGRPDVSVRGVAEEQVAPVVELCNRLIGLQARGALVPEGQPVRIAGLPDDWTLRHAGAMDDPDFNNTHLSVGPDRNPGGAGV